MRGVTIKLKILPAMAGIFLLAILLVTVYSAQQQRERVLRSAVSQVDTLITSHLDSLNAMMLTGTMDRRDIVYEKLDSHENVIDSRTLRSSGLAQTFGPGTADQQPVDGIDRRVLDGERVERVDDRSQGRVLVVARPFRNAKDYHGTNCTGCHANQEEGAVLGAARVEYSLAGLDASVMRDIWVSVGINLVIFLAGLVLISLLINRVVLRPLRSLRDTTGRVAENEDLTPRIPIHGNDEFRNVAEAVNRMLDHFQDTVRQLGGDTERLRGAADALTAETQRTRQGANTENERINSLDDAMSQVREAAQEVVQNAEHASQMADDAHTQAQSGSVRVDEVSTAIRTLADRVTEAGRVVEALAANTESAREVLSVISNIAERTNLLALNAAIEAARAGEQGRGFAVVAEEVRSLANRTQKATGEVGETIEKLVTSSNEAASVIERGRLDAETSVSAAVTAGEALATISEAVDAITAINHRIADAAERQSDMVNRADEQTQGIAGISRETVEGAERTEQTSGSIEQSAESLETVVNRFRV